LLATSPLLLAERKRLRMGNFMTGTHGKP